MLLLKIVQISLKIFVLKKWEIEVNYDVKSFETYLTLSLLQCFKICRKFTQKVQ